MGGTSALSGSGILATITFTIQTRANGILRLDNIDVLNSDAATITIDTVNHGELFYTVSGDLNGDRQFDLKDAIVALQLISVMNRGDKKISIKDVINNDSKINMEEVIYIL